MRIAIGVGSEVTGTPMAPQDIVEDVVRAEADGFGSAWSVHFSRGVDALDVLAVAGARTSRIELGVGIVPTYPRHPLALAQQVATTQAFSGGRLTLGVGVSHRPVIEDLHGLDYTSPAAHMRDYLSVLVPLLREGKVHYYGEFYQVDGGFVVPGTSPVPVAVCADAGLAHRTADEIFARYAGFDNYRRLLDREGVSAPGDVAMVGTEAAIEEQVRRLSDLGVTELWPIVFPVGNDAVGSQRRTRNLLAELATVTQR